MSFWNRVGSALHSLRSAPRPQQPRYGWSNAFTRAETLAGVEVSEWNALNHSAVWACVRAISGDLASLPVCAYRRRPDGSRERAEDHDLEQLLNVEPNEEMTALVYRETGLAHALTWGNAYSEVERRQDGRPKALWPLTPDRVRPERDKAGRVVYRVDRTDFLPADRVLHTLGLAFDGLLAYSVIATARQSLGLALAAERYGASFFGNSGKPAGTLNHPGKLEDKAMQKIREGWESVHAGPHNAGRVAILREGMSFVPFSVPPDDAQFLQTRQFQVPEICRWFGVPPHRVQDLTRASFSNIEQQSMEYVTGALRQWAVRQEQEWHRKLLSDGTRARYFLRHDFDELLRGDLMTRFRGYALGRQWGWLSANDVLRAEGQGPIGEQGDVYLSPGNMTPADQAGATPAAGDVSPADPASNRDPGKNPDNPGQE